MVGELLNQRYQIKQRLGGGSQAEVFLATDAHMERLVAIKTWKAEGGFTVDEFLREAKLLARFGPPHFVTIHEHAATEDQRPFFVLEYLQGETLQDLSAPLTAQEIRRCVRDVCVGMQIAHDEGVVHRDLKPSNIMLVKRGTRSERYVILDLGIAKITDPKNWRRTLADATLAGAGTLLYMSPEQCNGDPIDQRTDVYSFGCLLFLLLVHEEPFAHKASHISVLNSILNERPPRLADVRPNGVFPEELEQLVQDCLAKKPEDRPASMTEVEYRFDRCFSDDGFGSSTFVDGGQSTDASRIKTRRPISSSTVPYRRRPKRRVAAAVLVALAVVAVCCLGLFLPRRRPEATIPSEPVANSPVRIKADDPNGKDRDQNNHGVLANDDQPALLIAPFDKDEVRAKRAAWARYHRIDEKRKNSIDMELILIPPGRFSMGSPETVDELLRAFPSGTDKERLAGERMVHTVMISQPFYLGKCEVTNSQFKKFVEETEYRTDAEKDGKGSPGYTSDKNHPWQQRPTFTWRDWGVKQSDTSPVVNVSHNDAAAFCAWLSRKEGKKYRLPTEAEWEYACRAGTTTRYYNGDEPEGLTKIGNVADATFKKTFSGWTTVSSSDGCEFTSPVGRFAANNFGLYDMIGNAWEWCSDWYDEDYYTISPERDPVGPHSGSYRVLRGGGWSTSAVLCRAAGRSKCPPVHRTYCLGFRVACSSGE
jgi:formylglycine-generating enzyme required for sulfatase activity